MAEDSSSFFSLDNVRDVFISDVRSMLAAVTEALSEPLSANQTTRARIKSAISAMHGIRGISSLVGQQVLSRPCQVAEWLLDALQSYAMADSPEAEPLRLFCLASTDDFLGILDAILIKDFEAAAQIEEYWMSGARQGWGAYIDAAEARVAEEAKAAAATTEDSDSTSSTSTIADSLDLDTRDPDPATIADLDSDSTVIPSQVKIPAFESRAKMPETTPQDDSVGLASADTTDMSNETLDPELIEVFRGELAEYRVEMVDAVTQLLARPLDATRYERVRRVFHRLKGTAAVVGLSALSQNAKQLELSASEAAAGERAPSAELASDFHVGLNGLLLSVGDQALMIQTGASETAASAGAVVIEPELLEAFLLDIHESGASLEHDLLAFEQSPSEPEHHKRIARHLHTLKGAAQSVGLVELGAALHTAEELISLFLGNPRIFGEHGVSHLVQALLAVGDRIKAQTVELQADPTTSESRNKAIGAKLKELLLLAGAKPASTGESDVAVSSSAAPIADDASTFSGDADDLESQFIRVDTRALDVLLNMVGELVVSRTSLDEKLQLLNNYRDALGACERRLKGTVGQFQQRFEYSSIETSASFSSNIGSLPRPGGQSSNSSNSERPGTGSFNASSLPPDRTAPEGFSELEFDKYDDFNILTRSMVEMVNDVSEVVAQIQRTLNSFGEDTGRFRRVTGRLQTQLMSARMVPIGTVFKRLLRPIRDAASREGRTVTTRMSGEEVAIDKNLVDRIFRPLLHIVRNAVCHGIESPQDRIASGKPAAGRLSMRAEYQANSVLIEISDDGKGLDFKRIAQKAIRLGLIKEGKEPTQEELIECIFAPGFSTRDSVTELAGRGIGLDVVRQTLSELKGAVSVQSTLGRGTTFQFKVPLTLTISQAMVIRLSNQQYALPIDFVELCRNLTPRDLLKSGNQTLMRFQDGLIPLIDLHTLLGVSKEESERINETFVAVVVKMGTKQYALQVDQVFARREIVIKSMGRLLESHRFFTGATLTGSGGVMLILDVPGLLGLKSGYGGSVMSKPIESPAHLPESKGPAASTGPRRTRVLVVDDSISVRRVASTYLKALQCDIELAVDGIEALEVLREKKIDIVFTDLEMPRLHGFELITEMQQNAAMKHIPAIVVTSRSGEKHQTKAAELGAAGYITKPFTREMLAAQIRTHVVERA